MNTGLTRRNFLAATGSALVASQLSSVSAEPKEKIIDVHQHTNYTGRSNKQLITHQKALGITTTVLLPAGSQFGLDCRCGGNETVEDLAREHPDMFVFFANEVCNLPEARTVITRFLEKGALGIGEQKFKVAADSQPIEGIAEIAQEYDVPVLLHFQHGAYNVGLGSFAKILKKYPKVNFIGHAQTWWGHVDKKHSPSVMYPKGKVTPGGLTDKLLSEFPNLHGDLSAGSGLNFLTRDSDHARKFLERHQNQLLFGTDCNDPFGKGPGCQGLQTLTEVRQLAANRDIQRKILYRNAKKLLKL